MSLHIVWHHKDTRHCEYSFLFSLGDWLTSRMWFRIGRLEFYK
jgi:hypothetical protein